MNNTRQLTELYKVDITKITNIHITSIGLLEIFGKLTITIHLKNKSINQVLTEMKSNTRNIINLKGKSVMEGRI